MKEDFKTLLLKTLPLPEANDLYESLQSNPTISLRINPKKTNLVPKNSNKVAHCNSAYYLEERPVFTADPAFHAGVYYVQEANSMWIGRVFEHLRSLIAESVVVLDLCAAPGGKTTHLSSLMQDSDLLVANEVISSRKNILAENVSKWGDGNTWVCSADPVQFGNLGPLFDMVFCDAPCSGEGMFRKDLNAQQEWSLENIALCSSRQQRIVSDSWNCLKDGGYFIYSTCTFNTSENEENVNFICDSLGGELVDVSKIDPSGVLYCLKEYQYRCFPHRSTGEGLFFAVIRKNISTSKPIKNKAQQIEIKKSDINGFSYVGFRSKNWLVPNYHLQCLNLLCLLPGLFHVGTLFGDVFKGKWKPHPAIALLAIESSLPLVELNDQEAMAYLRREFLPKKSSQRGVVIMRWFEFNIGISNSINNGLNNLWPMEWRVRNQFLCNTVFPR